jgi:RNA polymerase sigma-70 factor (ECF subfamily)
MANDRTHPPAENGPSDDALLAAIAARDERALRTLYERHAPWLAVRLRRLLAASAVEDVLQETFLAVWKNAGSYRQDGDVAAWLWGIARRQAANWARKHHRPELALDLLGERPGREGDPAEEVIRQHEIGRALAAAGPAGSTNQRIARKALVEDRPLADIAADMDMPLGTVKSRLHRIRKTLQAYREKEAQS